MCGIIGIFQKNGYLDKERLQKFCLTLSHRGPDDNGLFISPDRHFGFGHTRLSIIDLSSSGQQPMSNENQKIWMVCNGEIYNYRQLREGLIKSGHNFQSKSDAEVIIHGYEEWGIDVLLKKIRGMFSFCIYDIRQETPKIFLVRDRLGIKPLYYYQDNETLVFSSEVRSLTKTQLTTLERNDDSIIDFLVLGSIPAPLTSIKNIFSLLPGTYIYFKGGNISHIKYFDLFDCFSNKKEQETEEIYGEVRNILDEVIDIHLISDAPLGIFLSGGIDSSAITALASVKRENPLTTLSIIFDEEEYSELPYQRIIANRYKTEHMEIKVSERDFYHEMGNLFEAMDQPTIDGINTFFVARAAKQSGLKAVLSGLGGDEVFCGYESFNKIRYLRKMQKLSGIVKFPLDASKFFANKWQKLNYLRNNDLLSLYLTIRGFFNFDEIRKMLNLSKKEILSSFDRIVNKCFRNYYDLSAREDELENMDPINLLSYMELSIYLQNQLLKDTDFMSMYHSVETRVPFLDHVLVKNIASMSPSKKIDNKVPKPLLVKSLGNHDISLPASIIYRRKKGFTFPFDVWLRRKGKALMKESTSQGIINNNYSDDIWRRFEEGKIHWSKAWGLIVAGNKFW